MTLIAYHASSEQYAPRELLRLVSLAQRAGFDAVHVSDHFHPWTPQRQLTGFVWTWLGAAMCVCDLPFSVVTCPAGRYHPTVVAQAVATLRELHGDRLTMIAGSGELLNEGITGECWPDHATRDARMIEAVGTMRALWGGATVTSAGLVTVREARLYGQHPPVPPVWCAALSEQTARAAGAWADGLLVSWRPRDELDAMLEAFRTAGGRGKPCALKVDIAVGDDELSALQAARDAWGALRMGRLAVENTRTPEEFEALARTVRAEDMRGAVRYGDAALHASELAADASLGFDRIIVHCVAGAQERFIEEFSDVVRRVRER